MAGTLDMFVKADIGKRIMSLILLQRDFANASSSPNQKGILFKSLCVSIWLCQGGYIWPTDKHLDRVA